MLKDPFTGKHSPIWDEKMDLYFESFGGIRGLVEAGLKHDSKHPSLPSLFSP
jgi:hypothetical protein